MMIGLRSTKWISVAVLLWTLLPGTAFPKTKKKTHSSDALPKNIPKAIPVTEDPVPTLEKPKIITPRPMAEVTVENSPDGASTYTLAQGDVFDVATSPDPTGKALSVEVDFVYDPALDLNSLLVSQGGPKLGWALHLVEGKPSITINNEGLTATLKSDEPLTAGHVILRGLLGLDGTLSLGGTGLGKSAQGFAPMEEGFSRKPDQGLTVGQTPASPESKVVPNSTTFQGNMIQVRLSLHPGVIDAIVSKQ
jgi:hypothetical protein